MSGGAESLLCPVCEGDTSHFATATVLATYDADYRLCSGCGMVFVPDPHWLAEAYSSPIASTDIGLVSRTFDTGLAVRLVMTAARVPDSWRCLDFAGGTGMLVRFLRDSGYPFEYHDEYPANRFAAGYECLEIGQHEVVTAFEVLEHLADPIGTCARLLPGCELFICTTELLPDPPPGPNDWWYYTTGTGQHVTLWTERSLQALARRFEMHLSTAGSLHVLSRRRLPPGLLWFAARHRFSQLTSPWTSRPTLRDADYERAIKRQG